MDAQAQLVSVIMPLYNAERHVREAVESILQQTHSALELLIVDDCSTDGGPQIAAAFQDSRIRFLKTDWNCGAAGARNFALEQAKGQFLAFLDADDAAEPERIERQLAFLHAHPSAGVVATATRTMDERGALGGVWSAAEQNADDVRMELFFSNPIVQSSVMLRAPCLEKIRFREEFIPAEDYDLWCRLSSSTEIYIHAAQLTRYRIHGGGISTRNAQQMIRSRHKIWKQEFVRLDISPSSQEIECHEALHSQVSPISPKALQEAGRWLEKLVNANDSASPYHPEAWRNLCALKWLRFCKLSISLGLTTFCAWRRSTLRRTGRDGLKDGFALFSLITYSSARRPLGCLYRYLKCMW